MPHTWEKPIRTIAELLAAMDVSQEAESFLDILAFDENQQAAIVQSLQMLGCELNIKTAEKIAVSFPLCQLDPLLFNNDFRGRCGLLPFDGVASSTQILCKRYYNELKSYIATADFMNQHFVPNPKGGLWDTMSVKQAILRPAFGTHLVRVHHYLQGRWRDYAATAMATVATEYTPRMQIAAEIAPEFDGDKTWCVIASAKPAPVAVLNFMLRSIRRYIPADTIFGRDVREDPVANKEARFSIPFKEQTHYGLDDPQSYIGSAL